MYFSVKKGCAVAIIFIVSNGCIEKYFQQVPCLFHKYMLFLKVLSEIIL